MSIVNRYIFKQFFPPFLIGYSFFTLVLLIQPLEKIIALNIEKGIPFIVSLKLFIYILPAYTALTAPMGVLFSGLLTLGRMSSDNELIALRASGYSVLRLSIPAFIYGIFMTLFMLWFMNYVLPESNYRYRLLLINANFSNPSIFLETKNFKNIPYSNKKITAFNFNPKKQTMENVYLYEKNDKNEITLIHAQKGRWLNNEINSQNIKLELKNGEIIHFNIEKNEFIEVSDFKEFLVNIKNEVTQYEKLNRGLREQGAIEVLEIIQKKEKEKEKIKPVFYVEYHKKISLPIACIFFMFIAVPLSITLNNRSGKGISFGIAIVIIFIYYVFLILGETLGKKAIIPPKIGMYLPNLVIFLIGLVFFAKIIRK